LTFKKTTDSECTVAFIVARLSSSRLEAKHFQAIGEHPLIAWTVAELKRSQEIDRLVIATVDEPDNLPLQEFAVEQGIECFSYPGDVNHVTTRLRVAAEKYSADICVLISGDCPLMSAELIDDLLRQFRQQPDCDFLSVPLGPNGEPSALEGVGIYRREAWQRADDLSDRPELKEHHFPVLGQRPELFNFASGTIPPQYYFPRHRFSVDTQADLDFMRRLHAELTDRGEVFTLPRVLQLLREKPELLKINRHVHQRRLIENVKKTLCVVDVGEEFGYGHLMRSLELAGQLTERLSWPVTFMTDDPRAAELLAARGIRVLHGALGRQARGPAGVTVGDDFVLCLLDLAARPLAADWRGQLPGEALLVALDSVAAWTAQADLIVIPGVTGPATLEGPTSPLRQGLERVILRREIRQLVAQAVEKDLDLLCYAHSDEREEQVVKICQRRSWSYQVVRGQRDDFPQLLARSRVFLGNFGYSFYEALALGCQLIAWPLSEQHAHDAGVFFRRLGLPVYLPQQEISLEGDIDKALQLGLVETEIIDGTPQIVTDIAALFASERVLEVTDV